MAIMPYLVRLPGQEQVEYRQEIVSGMEEQIDKMLSNPNTALVCHELTENGPCYAVKFPFTITPVEELALRTVYLKAGWRGVGIFMDIDMTIAGRHVTIVRLYGP